MIEAAARRRPGRVRSLTKSQIVDVGLELMERGGLAAVSLRAIAMRLGVDSKALYTYIKDKDDLLAGMFDVAMHSLDVPRVNDPRPPAEQIVDLLVSLRRRLIGNAELFFLARPSSVPGADLDSFDRTGAALAALGLPDDTATRLYEALLHMTVGSALFAARTQAVEHIDRTPIDHETYPHIRLLSPQTPLVASDESFAATLREMIDATFMAK